MVRPIRRRVIGAIARILNKPIGTYQPKVPNDPERLRRYIRKGDVVLVEGNQRISEVIKYLTQSTWSHAALYIGDELFRRSDPTHRQTLVAEHGDDARHLIVEALMEGVVAVPLSKYTDFTIRICRPYNLRREDLNTILDDVIGQIGNRYDIKNILDLGRYFLPLSLVPRRFRRQALTFGSGQPTEVICSSLIASAFQRVGFPILPQITYPQANHETDSWLRQLLRWRDAPEYHGRFRRRHPTLITPRDFDLSPYFDTLKFNMADGSRFDYRRITWAEDDQGDESAQKEAG